MNPEKVSTSNAQEKITSFEHDFLEVTNPSCSTGRLVFSFIRRELMRFHLENYYNENYIISEVYLRARNQFEKGINISNTSSWIKAVAYRIIRELSRADSRSISWDNSKEIVQITEELEDWQDHFDALRQAINRLSPIDSHLLNLKIVEGKSWSEIRDIMRANGYGDVTEATWRKRKERALSLLRKHYHHILPSC